MNKACFTVHIGVTSPLMFGMYIPNVLHYVSQMCALGAGCTHMNCDYNFPKNVIRGDRLVTFKMCSQWDGG